MPPRMVAFDTESKISHDGDVEVQEWRVGCAIRWRTDLKSGDRAEGRVFDTPEAFWEWVSEWTRKGTRTVVWAHNLGHDVRISRMFEILPLYGYHLDWCNLDRNISSATWRSDHGTIVLADSWTWIPLPLNIIAPQVGMVKYEMPRGNAAREEWARYCMQDAEILYHVVSVLMGYITSEHLGNWQPTGAGMAYTTWRHRFMEHKVLCHDDNAALEAERHAMHTGRAEAWRHGKLYGEKWTEVDLRNAYVSIAASTEVPRKLHMHHGAISIRQFQQLRDNFAVLCRVTVRIENPATPCRINGRVYWPTGTFDTWLWDCELSQAIEYGAEVVIHECYTYVRAAVLGGWAKWTLSILYGTGDSVSPIVRTHIKHCARALIGRLSLRTPSWEQFGRNDERITGISYVTYPDTGKTHRLLHVGDDVLIETGRTEGKDSLPMITGYIMATCRTMIWEAMNVAGLENVAHVDTDSILVNATGLDRMQHHYALSFERLWSVKGTYRTLEVHAPRSYFRGGERVTSGIPRKAQQVAPGTYEGERWSALAADLADGHAGQVRVTPATWHLNTTDPRRGSTPGACTLTVAYDAATLSSANGSDESSVPSGL